MKIGLHKHNYGYSYAVYGGKPSINNYSVIPSTNLWMPGLPKHLAWVRMFSPIHKVDMYHSYNYIILNNKPWIISFESWLPRFFGSRKSEAAWKWGLNKLSEDNCRKILPISEAAQNFFFNILDFFGCSQETYSTKTLVVPPGIVENIVPRKFDFNKDKKLKFLFIGNDIVRKGGRPLISAFAKLIKNYDIYLTIVSNFNDDIVGKTDGYDLIEFRKNILKFGNVNILENVPNEVLLNEIYPTHDIFILPTLQDSFGFVLVEAMAHGLPIISTNQFAIPEIVDHGLNGYLIEIPLDNNRRSKFLSVKNQKEKAEAIKQSEELIEIQLIEYISKLINNPEAITTFGKSSQLAAKDKFGIEHRNNLLGRVYASVM